MATIASFRLHSLGARLFLFTGALVLGSILAAVGFTAWRSGQVARESVRETLAASLSAQARFEHLRRSQLRLVTRFAASDPSFVAYVAESDPGSVRDLLLERQRELECDLAVVLGRDGHVLARTDRPGGVGEDLSTLPIVADALRQGEASGLWTDGERWWSAVAVPLVSGGEMAEGVLVTGLAIDDQLAIDVRRQSGAEVAYVAFAPAVHVVASTLGDNRALLDAIAHRNELRSMMGGGPTADPLRLSLAGRSWAVRVAPLGGAASPVAAVTLASIDAAMAPFRRIENALLLVALLALVIVSALSYAVSRRLTRPLVHLADAADAARAGHYDQTITVTGDDEVGRLGRAFQGLLSDLREQREMESYLQTLSRSLPDQVPVPPPDADIARPGTVLADRFEILSWIGSGGMGVVYKARDRQLNDVVALKTLHAGAVTPEALELLKSELRIARRITHRNVLRTHDFGETQGMPFISMEYVGGVTLRGLLEHTDRLPIAAAVRIARQLAAGLGAAHAMDVIHRDIKPENLILDPAGGLRIMDFGIARLMRGRDGAAPTGELAGTFGYLSPEQLSGTTGDARSDLYACGVVMFEALAGRRPFLASTPFELVYRVTNEDPPSVRSVAPDVTVTLDAIVARCLARDPSQRFTSAAELRAALEEART